MSERVTPEQALSRTLASKAARRQELARLPYEQKIAIALELRALALSMKQPVMAPKRPKGDR
jgi:hypothetical protein